MRASGRGAGCRSPGCGVQPDGGRVRLHQDRLARHGAGRGGAGQGWAGRPCRGCAAGFLGPRGAGSLGWPASGFRGGQMGGPLTSQGAGVSWLRCHLLLSLCVPGGPASERGSASPAQPLGGHSSHLAGAGRGPRPGKPREPRAGHSRAPLSCFLVTLSARCGPALPVGSGVPWTAPLSASLCAGGVTAWGLNRGHRGTAHPAPGTSGTISGAGSAPRLGTSSVTAPDPSRLPLCGRDALQTPAQSWAGRGERAWVLRGQGAEGSRSRWSQGAACPAGLPPASEPPPAQL